LVIIYPEELLAREEEKIAAIPQNATDDLTRNKV